ncbi:MAG: VOC family protein, partial [Candidatus Binataceae bacterium]
PRDTRHIAFTIGSRAESDAWQRRFRAHRVPFWSEDHGGAISIYATDPNGHIIELTYDQLRVSKADGQAAAAVVKKWLASRHRPQRKKAARKGRG